MTYGDKASKLSNSALFFSNWLFIVFLAKRFSMHSKSTAAYLVGNIGSFLVALIITALMIHHCPKRVVVIAIPVMLALAILAAVF